MDIQPQVFDPALLPDDPWEKQLVRLRQSKLQALRCYARRRDLAVSDLIREAVDRLLKTEARRR